MTPTLGIKSLASRKLKLLLIEDDEEDKFVIEKILKRIPGDRYTTDWISSPVGLSERLKESQYDAILVDYFLGPKTAGDLVAEISSLCESAAIIVLTGKDAPDADEAAFGMAIDFFLSKNDLSPGGIDRAIRYAIRNRDQQVRLRNFSRLLAHDLIGPVGNARTAAQTLSLIMKDCGPDEKELLDVLQNDCDNIVATISALREFSLSRDGEMRPTSTELMDVLVIALGNLSLLGAMDDGRVVCESLPAVNVDSKHFVHVFQNLIQNALKYNKSQSPRVHIQASLEEGICELRFSDNGIGIDPSKASEVFLPMCRLHGTSEYAGTGLGLAVCREVVERHGGIIWLESSGIEGQGCTFCIRLAVDA